MSLTRAIYKFPFAVEDVQHIVMPPSARLLTVGVQDRQPVLWADCVDDGERTGRQIAVVTTGRCPPERGAYVGTFTIEHPRGRFVGHVYDLGEQTVTGFEGRASTVTAHRVETLFGPLRNRRFVAVSPDDDTPVGAVIDGHDGRRYEVLERHRFVEDHMLGSVLLGQTTSVVLFVAEAERHQFATSEDVPDA